LPLAALLSLSQPSYLRPVGHREVFDTLLQKTSRPDPAPAADPLTTTNAAAFAAAAVDPAGALLKVLRPLLRLAETLLSQDDECGRVGAFGGGGSKGAQQVQPQAPRSPLGGTTVAMQMLMRRADQIDAGEFGVLAPLVAVLKESKAAGSNGSGGKMGVDDVRSLACGVLLCLVASSLRAAESFKAGAAGGGGLTAVARAVAEHPDDPFVAKHAKYTAHVPRPTRWPSPWR